MYNLEAAYELGYILVHEAKRYSKDATMNEDLVTLAMLAVLYEVDDQWIIERLSSGCESNIRSLLAQHHRH